MKLVASRIDNQVFNPAACPLSRLYDEVQAWLREGLGCSNLLPTMEEAEMNYDLAKVMFHRLLSDAGVRP